MEPQYNFFGQLIVAEIHTHDSHLSALCYLKEKGWKTKQFPWIETFDVAQVAGVWNY